MKSTYDKFIENLTPEEKKQFEEEQNVLLHQISKSFNEYLSKRFTAEELHEIMLQVMEEHNILSRVEYEIEDFEICSQCNKKQRFSWRDLCYDCKPPLNKSKKNDNAE